jgi:hypothetical protein
MSVKVHSHHTHTHRIIFLSQIKTKNQLEKEIFVDVLIGRFNKKFPHIISHHKSYLANKRSE